ncbi:MAG TPA: Nramp family divalent metal transporter [Nitrospirota bacterium]|nr:Nramp family divalent metal transporter [Nitrospirota bacterium]
MDTNTGRHKPAFGASDILKYIGPGFLVTVGFIDPGNWATNVAAGSLYGYDLLWIVTLSTLMLILLQHNAAHLGIVTGFCLSEASTKFLSKWISRTFLFSAILATISTALAEILGSAIGLQMLLGLPLSVGAVFTSLFAVFMLISNRYRNLERWIIAIVSLIGMSFLFELILVKTAWGEACRDWVTPSFPSGAMPVIMSVLGAVVMPHNIFLHSEIIQSRQWNRQGDQAIERQLKFELLDTLAAMGVGWAINSAMILVAASVFHANGLPITELPQAQATLKPLLGNVAATVFALALIFSGLSSSITATVAGGSIYAGIFMEPYDPADSHSRQGIFITVIGALIAIFLIRDPFKGLIWSQIILSIQLPFTILVLLFLTSSQKVMAKFTNSVRDKILLWCTAVIVIILNIMLFVQSL